jgi:hypothetical protein
VQLYYKLNIEMDKVLAAEQAMLEKVKLHQL